MREPGEHVMPMEPEHKPRPNLAVDNASDQILMILARNFVAGLGETQRKWLRKNIEYVALRSDALMAISQALLWAYCEERANRDDNDTGGAER